MAAKIGGWRRRRQPAALAVSLIDNIETVIYRLIDFYESRDGVPVPPLSPATPVSASSTLLRRPI